MRVGSERMMRVIGILQQIDDLWRDVDDLVIEVQEYRDKAVNTAARPTDSMRIRERADAARLNVVEQYIQAETEKLAAKQEQLQERINWLRGYLDKMDRIERNVLSQRYIMHRHPKAIAEALGYSESHVYKIIASAEKSLAALAKDDSK